MDGISSAKKKENSNEIGSNLLIRHTHQLHKVSALFHIDREGLHLQSVALHRLNPLLTAKFLFIFVGLEIFRKFGEILRSFIGCPTVNELKKLDI